MNADGTNPRQIQSLACYQGANAGEGAFVPYLSTAGLPWRTGLRQWQRWTTAIPKQESEGDPPVMRPVGDAKGPLSISDMFVDVARAPRPQAPVDAAEGNSVWKHWENVDASLMLGKVLHDIPITTMLARDQRLMNDRTPTFYAHAPNVGTLLHKQSRARLRDETPVKRIIVRFRPDPWTKMADGTYMGPRAAVYFPDIILTLQYGTSRAKLYFEDMRAILNLRTTNVMLPDKANDLRVQTTKYRSILPSAIGRDDMTAISIPGLADFLKRATINPHYSQQLSTPASIVLPIAADMCREGSFAQLDAVAGTQDRLVHYLYAGLEYKHTIAMSYDGDYLDCSFVQGGQAGGSRSEYALSPPHTGHAFDPDQIVATALELARGADNHTGQQQTVPSLVQDY